MRSSSTLFCLVCLNVLLFAGQRLETARAEDPPDLRYGFEQGKQYHYDAKIDADIGSEKFSRSATLTYTVEKVAEGQFTLRRSGTLGDYTSSRRHSRRDNDPEPQQPGPPGFFVPRFGAPVFPPSFGQPLQPYNAPPQNYPPSIRNRRGRSEQARPAEPQPVPETTFTRKGNVVLQNGNEFLPFLLGYQDLLIIEQFSEKPMATWNKKMDVAVVRDEVESSRAAKEETTYTVVETKGTDVHLTKKYSMKTAPNEKGVSLVTLSGSGDLEFDAKGGFFQSLDMKYSLLLTHDNIAITVPVSLSYHYVTDKVMAERQERAHLAMLEGQKKAAALAEKRKQEAAAKAEAEKPKPLTPEMRAQVLKDLRAADGNVIKAAANRLEHSIPGDNADEISAALVHAIKTADDWGKGALLDALKVWGTANCEKTLIECSKSGNWWVRDKSVEQLGLKFKSQAAIDAVVAQFHNTRGAASAALKKIGPAAEEATLPFIKDRDFWLRNDAIGVLAEIGGKKSQRALKRELSKTFARGNPLETGPFNNAINAIERRLPSDDDDTATDKPEQPKIRTWQDASGSFEVDAALVGVKDDKVTLKKKDGKEITVPISKLSDDDQEYLKAQTKSKPANPFE